jgi:CheY-like chemotaxis protein
MPKLLIIEDDALTAKVYRDFFERSNFKVEVVPEAEAGLQKVEGADIIVVDIIVPKMGGIEFIKRVRADQRYKNIPMIAYTTAFIPALVDQAKAAGANDVFDKASLNGPLLKSAMQQYLPASSE